MLPSLTSRSVVVALTVVAAALVIAGPGVAVPDSPTSNDTTDDESVDTSDVEKAGNTSTTAELDGETDPSTDRSVGVEPNASVSAEADAQITTDSIDAGVAATASANLSSNITETSPTTVAPNSKPDDGTLDVSTTVDEARSIDTTSTDPSTDRSAGVDPNASVSAEADAQITTDSIDAGVAATASTVPSVDAVDVTIEGNTSVSTATDGIDANLSTGANASVDAGVPGAAIPVATDVQRRLQSSDSSLNGSGADVFGTRSIVRTGETSAACSTGVITGEAACHGFSGVAKGTVAGDDTSRAAEAIEGDHSVDVPHRELTSTPASETGTLGAVAALIILGRSVTAATSTAFVVVALSVSTTAPGVASGTVLPVVRDWDTSRVRVPRLGPLAGYSRFDDSDPLENDIRHDIYRTIGRAPGIYLARVADTMGIAAPTVRYHARILEEEGLIHSRKTHGRHRLYPMDCDNPELSAALTDNARASLLHALAHREPATFSDLASELDRSSSTVSYHLSRLEEDGLVERQRDGRAVLTRLVPAVRDSLVNAGPEADAPVPRETSS